MTLQEMMKHFFRLYGRRNRIFLSGLRERIDFLNLAIGDLQEAIRKEHNSEVIEVALARVVARIICVAESFWSLPLIEALAQKYPTTYCSYCHKFPCACSEYRPDATLELIFPNIQHQIDWSLKDWQEHFRALYGQRNKAKGIENLLNRLFKEISELLSLQMMVFNAVESLDDIDKEFAFELADALAWTIAISNFLDIDIEKAVLNRFGSGCWKCYQIPCICIGFNVKPVKWEKVFKI